MTKPIDIIFEKRIYTEYRGNNLVMSQRLLIFAP